MEKTRKEKLRKLKELGINPYPYRFKISDSIGSIRKLYEREIPPYKVRIIGKIKRISKTEKGYMIRILGEDGVEMPVYTTEVKVKEGEIQTFEGILSRIEGKISLTEAIPCKEKGETPAKVKEKYDIDPQNTEVSLGGRLISLRTMGRAIFGHIQDLTGKIQIYLRENTIGKDKFHFFNEYVDTGDILGIKGKLFRTKTGELTVEIKEFELLAKCLNPPPEKWHGLKDPEVRYKQRYLDLIANTESRRVFLLRSQLISAIRRFMESRGFVEVETPILQTIASGATAKPFVTRHNYLDRDLYLRIAPELYLKRLIVGGFPRVYEIGKNFRNEGIDRTHNPEFTMIEFYVAYWDYKDLMDFTEELLEYVFKETLGTLKVKVGNSLIDFTPPYRKVSYFDLLKEKTGKDKDFFLKDLEGIRELARDLEISHWDRLSHRKLIDKVFEKTVEKELIQPTFVVDFPRILSPLAKTHREDSDLVERFELIVNGWEIANAYTELNDPQEQRERFLEQIKEKESGDEEAMAMDEDFITALEYGMPPTAGEGIGIDRLVMLIAGTESIREVILFPHI